MTLEELTNPIVDNEESAGDIWKEKQE
jgi:hypothetical protein